MLDFLKRISLIESLRISSNIFLTYLSPLLTPFKTCPTSLPNYIQVLLPYNKMEFSLLADDTPVAARSGK